ncbi:MAG: hypothetical protein NC299_12510 [Lachnospiraceae bacterium]|nr:hypothetical protein [Ruminococcus sp.]MCM1276162.1 hypothetical protein [Lachnospiraceae bacterium]
MKRIIAILMVLGLLRGCSYAPPVGGMTDNFVEAAPSTSYTIDLSGTRSPYVLSVTVEDAVDPHIYNMLDVHVLHTGVVGRFGCPVEVTGAAEGSRLIFRYDGDKLYSIRPENLIVLYYDDDEDNYIELMPKLDGSSCTVSLDIGETRDGTYMLVDSYAWLTAWGAETVKGGQRLFRCEEGGLSFSVDLLSEVKFTACSDYFKENDDGIEEKDLVAGPFILDMMRPPEYRDVVVAVRYGNAPAESVNTDKFGSDDYAYSEETENGTIFIARYPADPELGGYGTGHACAVYPDGGSGYVFIEYYYIYESIPDYEQRALESLRSFRWEN